MADDFADRSPTGRPLRPMTRALLAFAAAVSLVAALTASAAVARDVADARTAASPSLTSR